MGEQKPPVLVIDDDLELLEVLEIMMQTLGFEVTRSINGTDGWEQFQKGNFPLVMSDIYMPGLNGVKLMEKIKAEKPETCVILMTGYANYKELTRDASRQPNAFLMKPFDLEELKTTIITSCKKS